MALAGVFIAYAAIKLIVISIPFIAMHAKKDTSKTPQPSAHFLLSYSSKSLY
jgi:hypothetical protein